MLVVVVVVVFSFESVVPRSLLFTLPLTVVLLEVDEDGSLGVAWTTVVDGVVVLGTTTVVLFSTVAGGALVVVTVRSQPATAAAPRMAAMRAVVSFMTSPSVLGLRVRDFDGPPEFVPTRVSARAPTPVSAAVRRRRRSLYPCRPMTSILTISGLGKTYASGHVALSSVDLGIRKGEIFALLGPNGAGKTTLISIVCGIVTATQGTVTVGGHDNVRGYRAARSLVGLVPQELHTDMFETPWSTASFSRGLFGLRPSPAHIEKVLRDLSLWDKRDARIMTLSGGMKRRVMIAKALAHEPEILFLDEPTAGVDVELRRDMWALVRRLRDAGATIILTTHYIDEAEEMADRIGVINKGRLVVVEEKAKLMKKLGKKQLTVHLQEPMAAIPAGLSEWPLVLKQDGAELEYTFDAHEEHTGIPGLLKRLGDLGIGYRDLNTRQSSLEEIFVDLVTERKAA